MFDMDALRLWRARVFISGPRQVKVRLRLQRHQGALEGGSKPLDLRPTEHVLRSRAAPIFSPDSYAPISSREIFASPPMLVPTTSVRQDMLAWTDLEVEWARASAARRISPGTEMGSKLRGRSGRP